MTHDPRKVAEETLRPFEDRKHTLTREEWKALADAIEAALKAMLPPKGGVLTDEGVVRKDLTHLIKEIEDSGTKRIKCWECKKAMYVPVDVDGEGIPTICWRCREKEKTQAAAAASGREGEATP